MKKSILFLIPLAFSLNVQAAQTSERFNQSLLPPESHILSTAPNDLQSALLKRVQRTDEKKLRLVANAQIVSALNIGGEVFDIAGRASVHLEASDDELVSGEVKVAGFNVVYLNAPQGPLSDRDNVPETGVVGFAVDPEQGAQYLDYDPVRNTISGKILGYIDTSFMNQTEEPMGDADNDYFETPKQSAYLNVNMSLTDALDRIGDEEGVTKQRGTMSFEIEVLEDGPIGDSKTMLPKYSIRLQESSFEIESARILWIEVAKRLCIQPVRIGAITWKPWPFPIQFKLSGAGLNFGMPGATKQWNKADVVFTVKDWITLWKPQYMVLSANEAASLRNEVSDSECVEVFFVDDLDPESMWGGGATWGLGTAGTKIITSDGNARGGIDLTHLAHELGHSMGLPHPTGAPGVSTNTLMCPSGWMNDNPKINSQENKDNIVNPLFTFAIKLITPGPDCQNSADCGSCP